MKHLVRKDKQSVFNNKNYKNLNAKTKVTNQSTGAVRHTDHDSVQERAQEWTKQSSGGRSSV